MASFDDAFDALINNEGGYANVMGDPGGETMYGITESVARDNGYEGSMHDLPLVTAKQIAKKCYWDVASCDQLDSRLAFQVFDTIYNGGDAIKWLQQACNVKADGLMGPATIAATQCNEVSKVIMRFNSYRLQYYTSLKIWPKFGKGWTNRISNNLMLGAK